MFIPGLLCVCLQATGNVYGSCDRPHLLEAELYTGIDAFQFDLGISISLFGGDALSWQKTLVIDSLSNKRLQLGTGCLVHPGVTSSVGLEVCTLQLLFFYLRPS